VTDLALLAADVRAAIRAGGPATDADFEDLCLAIAGAQGRLREGDADGLDRIEPVPEGAFKLMTVACFPPSEAEAEFRTSGTTTGSPGRHLVRDLRLYRESALAGFDRFVLYPPRPARVVTLIPPGEARPSSSLSRMVSFALECDWALPPLVARDGDSLALDRLLPALRGAGRDGEALVILGTSLDFLTLLEALAAAGEAIRLPAGSRVMHTGGEKASGRELSREALAHRLVAALGIAPEDAVEEFGMTELLSQAYDAPRVTGGGPRRLVPVPWMRSRVLDPGTLAEVPAGATGLVCHYDLANVHTAVAVLTGDLATGAADGFSDVRRAPGAAARGCSSEASDRWTHSRTPTS